MLVKDKTKRNKTKERGIDIDFNRKLSKKETIEKVIEKKQHSLSLTQCVCISV